jgi:hypothetical protein
MKQFLLVIGLFTSVHSFSQVCNVESLLQKQGTWKETSAVMSGISATELEKEKKTLAAINSMIKSRYSPIAVNALANGGYHRPESYIPVNEYIYSIRPMEYYCDGNAIKTVGETATYFHIGINNFFDEIYDTAQGDRALLEGFNVLSQMPRSKDGFYYFDEKDVNLGMNISGKSSAWLVTYDGKLPWSYVTRKEFLEKRKRSLSVQKAEETTNTIELLKNMETAKEYKETEFKNDPTSLQRFMKMDYQPSKERYQKQLAEIETKYKSIYNKIDEQLKIPAAELNENAIVKMDPKEGLLYLFTTEDDPLAKILIKPNPAYFNTKLPRSVPQFFSVYIRGNHNDPVVAKAMTDLKKAIDFEKLKTMLGK